MSLNFCTGYLLSEDVMLKKTSIISILPDVLQFWYLDDENIFFKHEFKKIYEIILDQYCTHIVINSSNLVQPTLVHKNSLPSLVLKIPCFKEPNWFLGIISVTKLFSSCLINQRWIVKMLENKKLIIIFGLIASIHLVITINEDYGNMGCWVFKLGVQN